ncbi:TetR family transcriptional regulator [Conexibacter sp. JD483]|uniref:TetR family transcriptional regulator n=1 Tax=unclassified Conexibacter TaxID=2627773 RepID=UPI0027263A5B|nr:MULTISPECIES: TetR family transcriptional regulator [unclassified Conexibacter]MDO8186063.1 TetR family transcriptional regulator [Conexibacter sp. CPCC 205706]MDO8199553.1 TetR family transcriptional regulator [Conexibacter sp. CPCC 205762]MDR9372011.1 TetR family transcriptional regulator [Conexibacter sp. JD483]
MSTREGGSLRERKRAAAQARVVDVAIALFAERGFGDVSVAEICAAAEVSERSFFRWFAAKEEVVMEPMREMADRVEQAISAAPAGLDDRATVELGLRALADWMLADWERLTTYFRVVQETSAMRAIAPMQLPESERAMANQLVRRSGGEPPADWRTRLLVARGVAAFRVWLDDMRAGEVSDPHAHLDAILAAG